MICLALDIWFFFITFLYLRIFVFIQYLIKIQSVYSYNLHSIRQDWVSDYCQLSKFSAISYAWCEQDNFQWDEDEVQFVLDQHPFGFLKVLAHWNKRLQIDMSPHSDTLSWFQANHYLFFLLNAACLAGKQQIPIL